VFIGLIRLSDFVEFIDGGHPSHELRTGDGVMPNKLFL
jgi:hypothetical protein